MANAFRRPLVCPLLIGRAAEMELSRRAIESTAAGNGETLLFAGEAGIGKSRLAAEAKSYGAARGLLVLDGACFPQDRTSPYAPILDVLRARFAGQTSDEVKAIVGPFGRELHPLLPDLVPPPDGGTPVSNGEQAHRRLFTALAQTMLVAATRQPLLIVVEDLHWCDDISLDVLYSLARQAVGRPVMLLGTFRSNEADQHLVAWLTRLARERLAQEIDLTPLGSAEVAAMAAAIAGSDGVVPTEAMEQLITLAEGNPFYVEELLTARLGRSTSGAPGDAGPAPAREWSLPRNLQYAVLERAQGLSPIARDALRLAAVIGRRFDLPLLQRVARIDEPALLSAIKEMIAAYLVVEESRDRFTFRHALIQQGIYGELLGRERAALHRAAGEEAEALYGAAIEQHAADLAHHFTEAEVWDKALLHAQRAGDQAQHIHAPRAATEQFTRALQAAERLCRGMDPVDQDAVAALVAGLHRKRGQAREQLGDFDEAMADYDVAVEHAAAVGDHHAEWRDLSEIGLLWAGRDYTHAGTYFLRALELARRLDDPALVAASLNRVGNWRVNAAEPQLGLPLHREALTIFEREDDRRGIANTLDLLGVASYFGGDLAGAVAWYERAVTDFRELDDRRGLATSLAMLAFLGGSRDMLPLTVSAVDVAAAVRNGEEAIRLAQAIDWRAGEAFALFQLAIARAARGEYGRAIELAEEGLRITEEIDHHQWRALGHCTLGVLFLDLLAFQTAQAHFRRTLALADQIDSSFWIQYGSARLAVAHVAEGDVRQADLILTSDAAPSADHPATSLAQWWYLYAHARRALAVREPGRALHLLDQVVPISPTGLRERDAPTLAIARAEALTALGQTAAAEATLLAVQEAMRSHDVPSQLWRCHVALGGLYRLQGRNEDARRAFAAARVIIDALAMSLPDGPLRTDFLKRATALLPQAYRLSPRRATAAQFGGLTEREREVAALVARGKSNREIAETLVLGRRTVETHVANALTKLGASSRRDLAAWAMDRGLVSEAR